MPNDRVLVRKRDIRGFEHVGIECVPRVCAVKIEICEKCARSGKQRFLPLWTEGRYPIFRPVLCAECFEPFNLVHEEFLEYSKSKQVIREIKEHTNGTGRKS